jgi:hypothetical protein
MGYPALLKRYHTNAPSVYPTRCIPLYRPSNANFCLE